MRPWDAHVKPKSLGGSSRKPVAGVKRVLSLAVGQELLAFEATTAISRLEDGMGPVHLGNVR
jgi:hypothetical protein